MSVLTQVGDWFARIGRAGREAVAAITTTADRGVPWPPDEALPRLRAYDMYGAVYAGDQEHRRVFTQAPWHFEDPVGKSYLAGNVSGALTDLIASRLMGEGFTATVGNDAAANAYLAHLIRTNHLQKQCIEAAVIASSIGDAFLKARYDARQQRVVVNLVDAARVFPEWDEADAERMLACTIGTVLSGPFLWLERYEVREDGQVWIINRLFSLDGEPGDYTYQPDKPAQLTAHAATAGLLDEQATGLTRLPVVHIANGRRGSDPFGQSDYVGLMSLQGEINERMTGRGRVLRFLVRPIVYGPEQPADNLRDGRFDIENMEYLIAPPGGGEPIGVITWDASLSAVDNHLDDVLQLWAASAGVELSVVLPPESGGPVSGRAIKLSQTRTQATVRARQLTWGPALAELLAACTELAKLPGVKLAWVPPEGVVGDLRVLDPDEITIGFTDGLPADTTEEIDEQTKRVEAGLQSRKAAIMLLDGVSAEDAEATVAEIDAEQTGSLHLATATAGAGLQPTLAGSPSFLSLTGGGDAGETPNP